MPLNVLPGTGQALTTTDSPVPNIRDCRARDILSQEASKYIDGDTSKPHGAM